MLQLHLGPSQLLICVLNFPYNVSLFNSAGNMFQMPGPKPLTLLSLNVTELSIDTLRSFLNLKELTFFSNKYDLVYSRSGKPQLKIPVIAEFPSCICLIYLIAFHSRKCNH